MTEKIELILKEIRARKYPEAKKFLDELGADLDNLQKFFDEVKKLCRDSGRTNMVAIDKLESLIAEYGEKN